MPPFGEPPYKVERPTGRCCFTERPLQPGEAYVATLVEVPTQEPPAQDPSAEPIPAPAAQEAQEPPTDPSKGLGLQRLDVSLEAWERGERPARLFSHWRTAVPEPSAKKRYLVDDEALVELFRRLEDQTDERRLAFRFVLGLVLLRKRLLRVVEQRTEPGGDGRGEPTQEWWTVRLRREKTDRQLWNPQLDESRTLELIEQVGQILDVDF
jgi:hypothetical protein